MKKYLIGFLFVLVLCSNKVVANDSFIEPQKIRCTVYCNYGVTKSGCITRNGIAAMNNAMLGKTAILYECKPDGSMGYFIGIFEILDTGGNKDLKAGKRIDIYRVDKKACQTWINAFGDYVYLQIIDAQG